MTVLFYLAILIVLILAFTETPLFTVIAGLTIALFYFPGHDWAAVQVIIIELNRLTSMPVIIALPLFTYAGCLLTETGAPERVMNFIRALVGPLPGGLAMAAVCSCAFFAALTGTSGITIVAIGGILYPVLIKENYDEKFTLGLLTSSGSLGLLFPPSLPIILYGVVAKINIYDIFKASILPGALSIIALCIYAFVHQSFIIRPRIKTDRPPKTCIRDIGKTFCKAIWDWPVVIIIILGVYKGFVTIAEVSALVAVYVTIMECFILKELKPVRQVPGIIIESVVLSGAILIILGVSLGLTGYLVDEQIPSRILNLLTLITKNKIAFLMGLNVFLLMVGCVMDIFSAIIIVVPIIVPIALKYNVDPIHLCVIFLLNLEIGYSTPPIGMNLFISSLKFKKPVTLLYRASIPYLVILLILLAFVTYFPFLTTWVHSSSIIS